MTPAAAPGADDWQAFGDALRRYVQRRVAPEAADDLVGQVLLRLVEHRETLHAADSPAAWMYRVAANAVTDHYRRNASERRVLAPSSDGVAESVIAPPTESPDESSAETELAACMVPLIRGLPAPYAEALMLTDIQGLTQAEAARRVGISTSGMKSRVQRGRAKLKDCLLRCCRVHLDRRGRVVDYDPGCSPG